MQGKWTMAKEAKMDIDNRGINQGIIVADNTGNINLTIKETRKVPSLIAVVIKSLGSTCIEVDIPDLANALLEFEPDKKIEYNCVIKYKYIIRDFSMYYLHCDNILNTYDNSNMGSKARILRCIHIWYLEEKGSLLLSLKAEGKTELEKIQDNADYLIDKVKERIFEIVKHTGFDESCVEDIEIGITCFVCYCFMECKILEKPI